ncbi:MAG: ImmA/IrrE family metallo-endopeptidase [Oscillospiraceae bacterium]
MTDKMELSNKALAVRRKLGEDESSPIDIFSLVQTISSLTLAFYPLGKNISGACLKCKKSVVIAINSEMSIGRQRFSLAHELYHYFFDTDTSSTICSSKIGFGNAKEKDADRFASYFLMPSGALYEKIQECKQGELRELLVEEIVKLEQYFGVSRGAMLYRLQEEDEINASEVGNLQQGVKISAARLGYDVSLYNPSPESKKKCVLGHYILQAEKLLEEGIISNGKYEEFLLEAFRDDIVYGIELDGGDMID